MIAWEKMVRSEGYVYKTPGLRLDVWKTGDGWRWTVEDTVSGIYEGSGIDISSDYACEAAMRVANI